MRHEEERRVRYAVVGAGYIAQAAVLPAFAHARENSDLGGGALYDLGTYCVNAARYLFRAEPTEVIGFEVMGRNGHPADVDEMTSALLCFSEGRIAQFTVS